MCCRAKYLFGQKDKTSLLKDAGVLANKSEHTFSLSGKSDVSFFRLPSVFAVGNNCFHLLPLLCIQLVGELSSG